MENNELGFPTINETLNAWGENPYQVKHATPRALESWILNFPHMKGSSLPDTEDKTRTEIYLYNVRVANILERFQPAPAKNNPDQLAIYENRAKYDLDRRLTGKPGKMLRRMFPFASDSDCESFANWWRDTYKKAELTVKEAKDSKTIAEVYQTPCLEGFDMPYGSKVKPLNRSCMRYEPAWYGTPVHPCHVYGTGDFVLYWTETTEGKVASRVLVSCHKERLSAGPIYAANEQGRDALVSHLESIKADRDGNWKGAKLHRIDCRGDRVVMPYLDCVGNVDVYDEEYFVIRGDGDIRAQSTDGHVQFSGHEYTCDQCGEGVHEDEMYSGSNGEGCYCEYCYNDNFTCWEGETYHNSECANVYHLARYGRASEFRPYDGFDDIVYSETDREYWQIDDVTWCESKSDWIPNDMIGDGYEFCTDSGELFPDHEVTEVDGQWYHKDLAGLLSLSNGAIRPFLLSNMEEEAVIKTERELMTIPVYILADNYELGEDGNPVRNPELPLAA